MLLLESFEKTFSMTFIRMSIWCLFLMTSVLAPFATTHAASSGYWLEVETSVVHEGGVLDGQTTYRVYLNTVNENDYLSSCSGDASGPMSLTAPQGWYNSPYNASWNATGINPLFLPAFPELAFDSFLEIGGHDSNTSLGPSLVSGEVGFSQEFTSNNLVGSSFVVDDATGGAWFLPYPGMGVVDSHPGFGGEEKRVLVAQITSAGTIEGQITVQVFIEGDQGDEFRASLPFCPTGTCGGCIDDSANNYDPDAFYDDGSCDFSPVGCTDESACNYSPTATEDNGSCIYATDQLDCDGNCLVETDCAGVCGGTALADAIGVCNGGCIEDADGDGFCDDEDLCIGTAEECVIPGCDDPFSCNFNVQVTVDDGSCEYASCQWCDDPAACNYEGAGFPWTANANLCVYALEGTCDCDGNEEDAIGVCGGNCTADLDGDSICDDVDPCVGTFDACGVCNGPGATDECGCSGIPVGDCDCDGQQFDAIGVCGGNCAEDADGDGWCDACTNSPVEGYLLSTETVQIHTSGPLAGQTTYRVYLNCAGPQDYLNACAGDESSPLVISASSGTWFNDPLNSSWNATGINPLLFGNFPELAFDSFLTIGATSSETPSTEQPSSIWGDIDASQEFTGTSDGSNVVVDDNIGGAWFLPFPGLGGADTPSGFAGEDLKVLVMQMTTAGSISGQIRIQIFQDGDQSVEIRETFPYDSNGMDDPCEGLDPCFGDLDACGICEGPGPIFECGCAVLLEGECDCEGNQLDAIGACGGDCVEDVDGDGVCDVVAEGCTDPDACNFEEALTDDGSCIYPEPSYDCAGDCWLDSDGDGVCDDLEIDGCTDGTACNYNPEATEEDGTCATLDECGECGGSGTLGCTDGEACNYDAEADCDDGTCAYPEAYYGCDGACLNDADMDGVCDELEIIGCQDDEACNYDPDATDDSGDCGYAEVHYDCAGNCLNDTDMDGVCDELEILGCTDGTACNYNPEATEEDGTCATLDECGECGGSGTLGCIDGEACNYDAEADCDDGTCVYPEAYYGCDGACLNDADTDGVCDELEVVGCTDGTACNFNVNATEEDGSCGYAVEHYDCQGNCLNDADMDGVCDELEILGCTDAMACNFNGNATEEDGSCGYAEVHYDCAGNCLNDADMDGICDELEVVGCTDETACNFDPLATDDSGDCAYAEPLYDCAGLCLNDLDGDGVCDELEVLGCDDATACNFDAEATDDDGSCEYAVEHYDCEGNCLNDADMDGICDELEVGGCTYGSACNYAESATDDDGSCTFPGDPCDDEDDTTINDVLTADCDCIGEVDGLGDVQGLAWGVFPSPVRDMLNLQATDGVLPSEAEVHILSSTGQTLRTERLAGRTQIDVSDLASGIYFLSLRSPAMATTTRRFVVAGGE